MTRTDLAPIPTDELWALHEKIAAALAARLTAEKRAIENRLLQLDWRAQTKQLRKKNWPPTLSNSFPEIPESGPAVTNLGGAGKATALVDRAPQVGKADRRL